MNTVDNSRRHINEDMNRLKADLGDGLDHTIATVEDSLTQAKAFVDEKAQDAKKAASEASTLVSKAVDKTISTVNDGIEAGKQYIADQHLERIADDFSGVIKKYPVQSLFAGIGVGILIGNAMSRK